MSEMTITRALAELKLLHSRIYSEMDVQFVGANKKSSKKMSNAISEEEFEKRAKASYDTVKSLIERRKRIKSAIVASNAVTKITIGDREMTVAEAIERKDSINFENDLLNRLKMQYNSSLSKMNLENEKVQDKVDELLLTALGKENKQKASQEDMAVISKPYIEQNEWQIVNPLELDKLIPKLEEEIMTFQSNVDFVLSESNSITKIEITD